MKPVNPQAAYQKSKKAYLSRPSENGGFLTNPFISSRGFRSSLLPKIRISQSLTYAPDAVNNYFNIFHFHHGRDGGRPTLEMRPLYQPGEMVFILAYAKSREVLRVLCSHTTMGLLRARTIWNKYTKQIYEYMSSNNTEQSLGKPRITRDKKHTQISPFGPFKLPTPKQVHLKI